LARCLNAEYYPITSNFVKFALRFGGYDSVKAAFGWDDNFHGVEKGIEASGISAEATEIIVENLNNFLWPSVFRFLQKLIP
jgi:hypothetical protein